MTTRWHVPMAVASLVAITAAGASANGINPPRLRDGVPLKASCQERASDRQHELFRARLAAAGAATSVLRVRVGGATEEIGLDTIESVALAPDAADPDGFVPATLIRRGETKQEAVAVQVRVEGAAVRLVGFSAAGSRVDIDLVRLARCRTLRLGNGGDGAQDPSSTPVTKR
jgi:hypothetical protein